MKVRHDLVALITSLMSSTALAYACLNAFINKYLCGFFKKNNSPMMQGKHKVFKILNYIVQYMCRCFYSRIFSGV